MEDHTKHVLLSTNNREYREQIRISLSKYKDISFSFAPNPLQAQGYLQERRYTLIIIDEQLSKIYNSDFNVLLNHIQIINLSLNTIIVVPTLTEEIFSKYIKAGFTYLTDTESSTKLIPAVLKYLEEFSIKKPIQQTVQFKNLIVIPEGQYIIYKNCKILLSKKCIYIIYCLVKYNGQASSFYLQAYLNSIYSKTVSLTDITVSISRINRATKNVTGLKIIKNRYRVGYYLTL